MAAAAALKEESLASRDDRTTGMRVDAIVAGEGNRAAAITRKALFDSRDAAIDTLQQLRGENVHASRFIRE